MVYPALLPLMRTPRLPVVDWTDAHRRFKWTRTFRRNTKSGFCACATTFQTQSTHHLILHTEAADVLCHRDGWANDHCNTLLHFLVTWMGLLLLLLFLLMRNHSHILTTLRYLQSAFDFVHSIFLGAFTKVWKATISFVMSIGLSVRKQNSAPTGRIIITFDIWWLFFPKIS